MGVDDVQWLWMMFVVAEDLVFCFFAKSFSKIEY
jgi:hypothetical protein